jgi:hypothetical protein
VVNNCADDTTFASVGIVYNLVYIQAFMVWLEVCRAFVVQSQRLVRAGLGVVWAGFGILGAPVFSV